MRLSPRRAVPAFGKSKVIFDFKSPLQIRVGGIKYFRAIKISSGIL